MVLLVLRSRIISMGAWRYGGCHSKPCAIGFDSQVEEAAKLKKERVVGEMRIGVIRVGMAGGLLNAIRRHSLPREARKEIRRRTRQLEEEDLASSKTKTEELTIK